MTEPAANELVTETDSDGTTSYEFNASEFGGETVPATAAETAGATVFPNQELIAVASNEPSGPSARHRCPYKSIRLSDERFLHNLT